jgi:uncharacterized protein (TIGR03435 family)
MSRAIAGTVLAAWLCSVVQAQPAASAKPAETKLEFEVASVKLSVMPAGNGAIRPGPQGGPGGGDPGRLTYSFTTIRDLMVDAYSVKRSQISGAPSWLDSERFDILAKVPEGATKEQAKVMLQNLLAERFKLTLHRETKELPIYALLVGAKGPKLKGSTVTDAPPASDSQGKPQDAPQPPGRPSMRDLKIGPDGCPDMPASAAGRAGSFMMMTPNGECLISKGETMDGLAARLSNGLDRPVVDQTGLTGKYDFKLRYDASSMAGGRGGPKDALDPAPAGDSASGADAPPSILTALQEQLGLKLEAKRGPVELLVIDRVQKTPTKN